ncbi:MAG: MFS transporter [Acidobacteria bacterium]|nr:MFS transporter [Acidobacteriota bacterium]MCA1642872.1 MFS transporter [Acidobacteriota bacterium]
METPDKTTNGGRDGDDDDASSPAVVSADVSNLAPEAAGVAHDAPGDGVGVPRFAVVSASLLMFAALVDSQVVAALAPQIAAGLAAAKTSVAASVAVYSVAAACVALLLGRRGARVMRPAAWLPVAALIFVAANVVTALAPRVAIFWAGRAAAGLAGGLVSALVVAALADASSYARRGRRMTGVAVSYFLAPVLGVPVGTWLAGRAGWRAVFVVTAALVAVAALLVRQFPLTKAGGARRDEGARGEDTTNEGDSARDAKLDGARAVEDESCAVRASLWRLVMRSRSTRRGVVSAFFVSGGLVCLTTYLATWLSDAFGARAGEVAFVYAVAGAGAVAGGAAGGALADRFGKLRIAAWASLWMALFVLLVPTFDRGALLLASICAVAFLAALRVAPLQALVTELVASSERAAYVAARNASSQIGIAVAVAAGARAYGRWGLFGVGLLASVLTLCAWLSLRKIEDPHARDAKDETGAHEKKDGARGGARDARGRRVARRLAGVAFALSVVVLVVLPWLLSFAITKAGTRPDERARTDTPAAHGATFEDVTFTSSDGTRLSGWYLPSRTHAMTVVMTHGLFRSRYETLERGLRLWQQGYGVLLYDLRRHGHSAGEFSSIGYYERRDVLAALRFAEAREAGNRVVLFGVSMGAAATLLAAAEAQGDARIAGVVSESSFLSFEDTARHHIGLTPLPTFPFAPLLIKFTAWRMRFEASDFDALRAARGIRQPIMFIGSGSDRRMPNQTVLEPLYEAAGNSLKRKLVVAGATHGHAFDAAPDEYITALTEFLQSVGHDPDAR